MSQGRHRNPFPFLIQAFCLLSVLSFPAQAQGKEGRRNLMFDFEQISDIAQWHGTNGGKMRLYAGMDRRPSRSGAGLFVATQANSTVSAKGIPLDWRDIEAISFWARLGKDTPGPMNVWVELSESNERRAVRYKFKIRYQRWGRLHAPLSRFQTVKETTGLDRVRSIRFIAEGKGAIGIDKVELHYGRNRSAFLLPDQIAKLVFQRAGRAKASKTAAVITDGLEINRRAVLKLIDKLSRSVARSPGAVRGDLPTYVPLVICRSAASAKTTMGRLAKHMKIKPVPPAPTKPGEAGGVGYVGVVIVPTEHADEAYLHAAAHGALHFLHAIPSGDRGRWLGEALADYHVRKTLGVEADDPEPLEPDESTIEAALVGNVQAPYDIPNAALNRFISDRRFPKRGLSAFVHAYRENDSDTEAALRAAYGLDMARFIQILKGPLR